VKASQQTLPSPGQSEKGPVPIPVAVGLLGQDGTELPLNLKVPTSIDLEQNVYLSHQCDGRR
jgi:hypothetical protein